MLKVFLCQEEAKRSFICPTDTVANAGQKEKKTQINHYFPSLFKKGKKKLCCFHWNGVNFLHALRNSSNCDSEQEVKIISRQKEKKN